jgi:hypothetical protein
MNDQPTLAEQLGHASVVQTSNTYGRGPVPAATTDLDLPSLYPLARVIAGVVRTTPVRLGPGGVDDLICQLTVKVAAYMGREVIPPASVSPTAVLLATQCDACQHTLNWHTNYAGCTVPLCVCGRFQPPAEELPAVPDRLADVLRIVTEYVIESNDIGGLDANDLTDRLEQAGHQLPDTDEDAE